MLDRILNTLLILNQKIFFVGQSRWFWDTNRARQIEHAANRTCANILFTSEIFHAFAFVNTFSPHLLLLFVLNIYFNWDVFFQDGNKKIAQTTLHQIQPNNYFT